MKADPSELALLFNLTFLTATQAKRIFRLHCLSGFPVLSIALAVGYVEWRP